MRPLRDAEVNSNLPAVQLEAIHCLPRIRGRLDVLKVHESEAPASPRVPVQDHLSLLQNSESSEFFLELPFSCVETKSKHSETLVGLRLLSISLVPSPVRHGRARLSPPLKRQCGVHCAKKLEKKRSPSTSLRIHFGPSWDQTCSYSCFCSCSSPLLLLGNLSCFETQENLPLNETGFERPNRDQTSCPDTQWSHWRRGPLVLVRTKQGPTPNFDQIYLERTLH